MMRIKLVSLCIGSLALTSALTACGDRKETTATEGDSSTGDGNSSTTTNDVPTGATTEPATSTEPQTTSSGTAGESDSTTIPVDPTTGEPGCMDEMEGQANDATCTDASGCGCASGKCFLVPILGGWCGECLGDADCAPGGCTVPNPIDNVGSTCNMGEPGAGCETDEVCTDPANQSCGTLLEVMNIIKVATCGECATNADCTTDPMLNNCAPTYDVMNFTGKFVCVADASTPNGEGCNLAVEGDEPIGNKACMSGFCGEANVMGLLKVGVCGECNSNADCPMDKPNCQDPQVDLDAAALVASVCTA
jgi:hypothetical protein